MLVITRDYLKFKRTFFLNNLFKLKNPPVWYGLMFLSQQLKRNVIITNKNSIKVKKNQDSRKIQNSMELYSSAHSSSQNENIVNTSKKFQKKKILNFSPRAVLYMKSYVFLKYFLNCSSYQILRCAMLYTWHGVRKYWLSMQSNFNESTNNFP